MTAFELFCQHVQIGIADAERPQLLHRRQDVVSAGTRPAMTLSHIVELLSKTEAAGILAVTAVDDVAKRMHALLRIVFEPDPAPGLAVDEGDLFAST